MTRVEEELAGTRFAGRVRHFPTVGSTNAMALDAAQQGAPDGSVWVADEQTAGRGRGGHDWHSVAGDGLYVSVVVRPRLELARALWISLATGLAVREAVADLTGLTVDIRWPNDVLIASRKCGGILVETAAGGGDAALRYAVIGIGINVNHAEFPRELEAMATSLRRESDRYWDREDLLTVLLPALGRELDTLEAEAAGRETGAGLLVRFAAASTWVQGKRVKVEESGGYTGVTAGLDAAGFLLVAGDDGRMRTVLSGGVRAFSRGL